MKTSKKNQLKTRIMDIFDKLILSNLSQKQMNIQVTHLANHCLKLQEVMTEEQVFAMIRCFENSPVYNEMLNKYSLIKEVGFDKALENE